MRQDFGADWMKSHNLVSFDYKKMQIILTKDGKPVTIQGVRVKDY